MSEPFVAQIQIVAYTFAPRGWAFCDGQLLPIAQNTALFSLLGTTYGGNGQTNFALPNLQGASPVHMGQGPGLSQYDLGQIGGAATVALASSEMPAHVHQISGDSSPASTGVPSSTAALGVSDTQTYAPPANLAPMSNSTLAVRGGGTPHNNRQPYLVLNFIIAMQGVFPARN